MPAVKLMLVFVKSHSTFRLVRNLMDYKYSADLPMTNNLSERDQSLWTFPH